MPQVSYLGRFQGFSTAVPAPRPTPSQTVETRSKSTVFGAQKRYGRAGEIRTRGLLVPNQALYRAKLPPAQWANDAPLPDPLPDGERGVFKQTIARARPPRASPGPPGLGGCTGPSLLEPSPRTSSPPPGPGPPGRTRSPQYPSTPG